ncbi:hypothetical protein D9M73_290620 [compost metagenome]
MGRAHLVHRGSGVGVIANGAGDAGTVDLGGQGRGNAHQPHRLASLGKGFGQCQDIRLNGAAGAFNGEVGQVLG